MRVAVASKNPVADYWVGLEGSIEKIDGLEAFAWAVIKSKDKFSKARTASFPFPTMFQN